jgi:hypothetical protein
MFSEVRVIRAASLPEHLSSPKCLVGYVSFVTRTPLNIWMNSDALEERQHE